MVCMVALGAALGGAADARGENLAIDQVQRYCTTSWSRAGIHRQDWPDCTQEAIMHLLARVPAERLPVVVQERDSSERRELHRAIWRTVQRWRRAPRSQPLDDRALLAPVPAECRDQRVDALESALATLSARQRDILTLWSHGHSIREIAQRLDLPAPRVSDEKYKALAQLRDRLK
jgi:RNA polymerase sigma factor (sigma-70 family)